MSELPTLDSMGKALYGFFLGQPESTTQSVSGTNEEQPTVKHPPTSDTSKPLPPIEEDRNRPQIMKQHPILFYEKKDKFYEFTNFSPHHVVYEEKKYPTSEHLFQAFKFLGDHPKVAERIRTCGEGPMAAFDEAHKQQRWVRSDWKKVNIEKMEIALRLKFTQHADLKALLLGTGDAELIEDSPRDYFWGIGVDGSGRNELGKALMRLREKLRLEPDISYPDTPSQRDSSHLSTQDPPPLPVIQSKLGPTNVQPAPYRRNDLCEHCREKPKIGSHRYCGKTCAANATKDICMNCRKKPRCQRNPYCSAICATAAGGP